MESLLELAAQSGIWAVMFVLLFLYQITDSKKREDKYQTTIKELGESLKIVGEIKENVENISKLLTSGKSEKPDDTK